MGVEPTAARSARPATGFEDQGTHQGTTTPEFISDITSLSQFLDAVKRLSDETKSCHHGSIRAVSKGSCLHLT